MLYRGFYPPIHDKDLEPQDWFAGYYQTYVERDVRDVSNIGNLETFQRFVRLCAGRTGQLLNLSSLAADCGISHTTARQWISILQAGFIPYVVAELYKSFVHRGESPPLYFWRDRTGHEVDVVIDTGKALIPIEIKSGETISGSFFESLHYFTSLGPPAAQTGALIHGGEELYQRGNFLAIPWFQVT